MRAVAFYRWSLLLPVAVPAAVAPLLALPLSQTLSDAVGLFVIVSLYAFIPYAVVAFGLLIGLRNADAGEMRSHTFLAPWLMAGITALVFVLPALFSWPGNPWDVVAAASVAAGASLALGYVYVGLAHGLLALLRRCGCVDRAEAG